MILALNRLFSLATENNFTNDQEFSRMDVIAIIQNSNIRNILL